MNGIGNEQPRRFSEILFRISIESNVFQANDVLWSGRKLDLDLEIKSHERVAINIDHDIHRFSSPYIVVGDASMNGEFVEDIVSGKTDLTGSTIEAVYSKVSKTYAVYSSADRVMVQYADNDLLSENGKPLGIEQRLALNPLNPIKGEINGLLDGWRSDKAFNAAKKLQRSRIFDRRVADALTVALQGGSQQALELLQGVKADILEERKSIGRTEYLIVAAVCGFALFLLFLILSQLSTAFSGGTPSGGSLASFFTFIASNDIWLATAVGSLGALFSISMSIRSRDIRTDLERRDNVVDAILRVMIGAVSAVMLFSLFKSDAVQLSLGNRRLDLNGSAGPAAAHVAIVLAFLAGFSERLVGDFLTGTVLGSRSSADPKKAADPKADEMNPRGTSSTDGNNTGTDRTAQQAEAEAEERKAHDHDEGDVDACMCDVKLNAEEMTTDQELPEASGGVVGDR